VDQALHPGIVSITATVQMFDQHPFQFGCGLILQMLQRFQHLLQIAGFRRGTEQCRDEVGNQGRGITGNQRFRFIQILPATALVVEGVQEA
jgi:hypothetical protein